jgi:hypothetical protein
MKLEKAILPVSGVTRSGSSWRLQLGGLYSRPIPPGIVKSTSWVDTGLTKANRAVRQSTALKSHWQGRDTDFYCLSYTCTSCVFAPAAFVPVASTVVTFPSAETVTLDVPITFPPFFKVAS